MLIVVFNVLVNYYFRDDVAHNALCIRQCKLALQRVFPISHFMTWLRTTSEGPCQGGILVSP